jgi:ribosome maturation factor RimP
VLALHSFLKEKIRGDRSPLFVYSILRMDLAGEIRKLAEKNLSPQKFVVDVAISGKKQPRRVVVVVDGDDGMSIDDCAELSRTLSKELDDRDFFGEENYLLEVTTPGLDQPLKLKRQFFKNTGRNLKVVLKDSSTATGRLKAVIDEKLVLEHESGSGRKKELREIEIPFDDIDKAFVLISFK